MKKTKLSEGDFNALLMLLQRHVHLVSNEKYNHMIALAEETLKDIDVTDSPFLALALTLKCSIWSNDMHFKKQKKVRVYTTAEIIKTIIT